MFLISSNILSKNEARVLIKFCSYKNAVAVVSSSVRRILKRGGGGQKLQKI